ncbi:MAG: hypothetical protein CMO81_06610 [Waddliaceae bacterium]|nr:hypothetical protein [Waddliaceae bacterium]
MTGMIPELRHRRSNSADLSIGNPLLGEDSKGKIRSKPVKILSDAKTNDLTNEIAPEEVYILPDDNDPSRFAIIVDKVKYVYHVNLEGTTADAYLSSLKDSLVYMAKFEPYQNAALGTARLLYAGYETGKSMVNTFTTSKNIEEMRQRGVQNLPSQAEFIENGSFQNMRLPHQINEGFRSLGYTNMLDGTWQWIKAGGTCITSAISSLWPF